jgi:selenocysteine lyase/cysteine desulfurase
MNTATARAALATLLGAKPAEIAFTKNTTDGLNIAAHDALRLSMSFFNNEADLETMVWAIQQETRKAA